MYVITVEFEIHRDHRARFMEAIAANAAASLERESGCRQFDVCVADDDPGKIFLHELYDDRAAFDSHLASDHFKQFDETVRPWVKAKTVGAWRRAFPAED